MRRRFRSDAYLLLSRPHLHPIAVGELELAAFVRRDHRRALQPAQTFEGVRCDSSKGIPHLLWHRWVALHVLQALDKLVAAHLQGFVQSLE